jgi:hypothetical protein
METLFPLPIYCIILVELLSMINVRVSSKTKFDSGANETTVLLANAEPPSSVMVSGKMISLRLLQPLKQDAPILVVPLGIDTLTRYLQLENAYSYILLNPSGRITSLIVELTKTYDPIETRLSGNVT